MNLYLWWEKKGINGDWFHYQMGETERRVEWNFVSVKIVGFCLWNAEISKKQSS